MNLKFKYLDRWAVVSRKHLAGNDLDNQLLMSLFWSLAPWELGNLQISHYSSLGPRHVPFQLGFIRCFFLSQVAGERYVYKFVCDPDALFSMAFPDNQRPFLKAESECHLNEEDTLPLTHFEDNPAYLLDMDRCSSLPYAEGFAY